MNTFLWILQSALAIMFFAAGALKLVRTHAELSKTLGDWVDAFSPLILKSIGLLEVLGAAGLVLPLALNLSPILTPLAATGLALTMVGAITIHIPRAEHDKIIMNVVLFLALVCVGVGRLGWVSAM